MKKLSNNLKPILNLEEQLGNRVLRIDEPAGTKCPLAVVLAQPLHISEIKNQLSLPVSVRKWENRDQHYPLEIGYVCDDTKHVISGPLKG